MKVVLLRLFATCDSHRKLLQDFWMLLMYVRVKLANYNLNGCDLNSVNLHCAFKFAFVITFASQKPSDRCYSGSPFIGI